MDQHALDVTRRSLHGVAEYLLAGPQFAASKDIRLRVTPGGFGTMATPDLRVERLDLVSPSVRVHLEGTFVDLAARMGVQPRTLRDVYADGPATGVDDPVVLDPEAVDQVVDAFTLGDAALRAFAPSAERVLWPEHFDLAITRDEVNFGVSPGDDAIAQPYAYVGPWTRRRGDFWNTPFGAAQPMTEFADAAALLGFFRTGAEHASDDPPRD